MDGAGSNASTGPGFALAATLVPLPAGTSMLAPAAETVLLPAKTMNWARLSVPLRERVEIGWPCSGVASERAPATTTSMASGLFRARPAAAPDFAAPVDSGEPAGRALDVDLAELDLDLLFRQRRGGGRLPADEDQRVLGERHRGAVVEAQARRSRFCGAQRIALEQDVTLARGPPRHRRRQLAHVARDRHDLRRELGGRTLEEDAQPLAGEEQIGILDERIELVQLTPVLARSEEALGQALQRVAGANDMPAALPVRPVVRRSAGLRRRRGGPGGGGGGRPLAKPSG